MSDTGSQVFICYSREDSELMERLSKDLREQGLTVWSDQGELRPGTRRWKTAIERAIEEATWVIVLMSAHAKGSEWVSLEISYARAIDTILIPFLIDGDTRSAVPIELIETQRVDAREDYPGALAELLSELGCEPDWRSSSSPPSEGLGSSRPQSDTLATDAPEDPLKAERDPQREVAQQPIESSRKQESAEAIENRELKMKNGNGRDDDHLDRLSNPARRLVAAVLVAILALVIGVSWVVWSTRSLQIDPGTPGAGEPTPEIRDLPPTFSDTEFEEAVRELLRPYRPHLASVGLAPPDYSVRRTSSQDYAYWDGSSIVVPEEVVEPAIAFREYTHAALLDQARPAAAHIDHRTIESALAWYFPSSFQNDPEFPTRFPDPLNSGYSFNLENQLDFFGVGAPRPENPWTVADAYQYRAHQVWGGAFWELRGLLGREASDRLLAAAWLGVNGSNGDRLASDFVRELVNRAEETESGRGLEVLGTLERRGWIATDPP